MDIILTAGAGASDFLAIFPRTPPSSLRTASRCRWRASSCCFEGGLRLLTSHSSRLAEDGEHLPSEAIALIRG